MSNKTFLETFKEFLWRTFTHSLAEWLWHKFFGLLALMIIAVTVTIYLYINHINSRWVGIGLAVSITLFALFIAWCALAFVAYRRRYQNEPLHESSVETPIGNEEITQKLKIHIRTKHLENRFSASWSYLGSRIIIEVIITNPRLTDIEIQEFKLSIKSGENPQIKKAERGELKKEWEKIDNLNVAPLLVEATQKVTGWLQFHIDVLKASELNGCKATLIVIDSSGEEHSETYVLTFPNEEEVAQKEIESLKSQIKCLEAENENLKTVTEEARKSLKIFSGHNTSLKKDCEKHENQIQELKAKLEQYYALISKADEQIENITIFIRVEKFQIEKKEFYDTIPRIIFYFTVFNKSFFDIAIKDKIEGHIRFEREDLLGHTRLVKKYEDSVIVVKACSTSHIFIEQRLSKEEVSHIEKCTKTQILTTYYFDKLIINFEGTNSLLDIGLHRLDTDMRLAIPRREDENM